MHIMVTKSINHGTIRTRVDRKRTLDKLIELNVDSFEVLSIRSATFNEMQDEVDRLEESVRMNEISLMDAPMHGGWSNKLNISVMKTSIINLNAAINAIAAEKLFEASV